MAKLIMLPSVSGRISQREPEPHHFSYGRQQARKPTPVAFMDLSAIEERIMGMYGELPVEQLPAVSRRPDIHTKRAMEMFNVPEDQVTPAMRREAKDDNYRKAYIL